jgi:membrane protein implicated in regulation of membrane protease activity
VPWYVWLLIAVLALAGETASTAFVLLYVGVAAAITAVLAAAGLPFLLQLIVFIPLTLGLLSAVRPRTLALLGRPGPRPQLTGHARLTDRRGVVEQEVSDYGGMVRLGSGEFWSARAYPPGVVLPKGAQVRVMFVEGLTVFVSVPSESGRLPELPPDIEPLPPDEGAAGVG